MLDTTLRYLCTQRALTAWACPDMRYAAQAQARLHPGHTRQHTQHTPGPAHGPIRRLSRAFRIVPVYSVECGLREAQAFTAAAKLSTLSAPYSQYSPNWVQCPNPTGTTARSMRPTSCKRCTTSLAHAAYPCPSPPAPPLRFIVPGPAAAAKRTNEYRGGLWGAACAVPHTDAPARDAAWCGGARPRPHGQVRSALATATRRRLCARTAQRIHCGPCGLVSADLWLAHPIGSSGASACRAAPDTVCRMLHPEGLYCVLHPNMVYAASLHVVPEQTPS